MKIKVATLIEIIDETAKAVDDHNAKYREAKAAWIEDAWQNWLDEALPKWAEFSSLVQRKVQAREAVTEQHFKEIFGVDRYGYRHSLPTWSSPAGNNLDSTNFTYKDKKWEPHKLPYQFLHLRRLLEAIEDEFITTSALKEMGFRNLESLFRKATETDGQAKRQ